jgi:DNA repair protein RecN (Recombination protein N)
MLERSADRIADLERQVAAARRQYLDGARALSARRRGAAGRFAEQLAGELSGLAMDGTRCSVAFESADALESHWTAAGIDRVELQLSPNPGEELRPLSRIVSGGELSRVMLAIKTLASTDLPGKTLIFDEIDAGIGGQVADAVGSRLRALSARCQVLAITHLPQVASYGETHYRVTKHVVDNRTVTRVDRLSGDARVEEIGRMMGGREVTERVLAGARDLIDAKGPEKEPRPARAKGESERAKPVRR